MVFGIVLDFIVGRFGASKTEAVINKCGSKCGVGEHQRELVTVVNKIAHLKKVNFLWISGPHCTWI